VRALSWFTSTRWGRLSLIGAFTLAAGCGPVGCGPAGPPPPPPPTRTKSFVCTGAQQFWVVPPDVTSANFDVLAASGGNSTAGIGGLGGESLGTNRIVTPGDVIEIDVGCRGSDSPASGLVVAPGGSGGVGGAFGGDGGAAVGPTGTGGAGGGGASGVVSHFLTTPIVELIAGGGGGAGVTGSGGEGSGGPLAATAGGNAACGIGGGQPGFDFIVGQGGTAGCGTAGQTSPGFDGGTGGAGTTAGGGGGGGGLSGGGGGGGGVDGAGGGGASGYCPGCNGFISGVHVGDGVVTVTYASNYAVTSTGAPRALSGLPIRWSTRGLHVGSR
jgi:hypothetical protein